jgi:acyl carrier protein phosphodiesterase
MNYLAHFFLSFDEPQLLIGQFMGDYIKGSRYKTYPQRIQDGILLHRFIDSTTDHSHHTESMRDLLRNDLGRYAGIALDVYYDHFLALNWNTFHNKPLEEFIQWVYSELSEDNPNLNEEMNYILRYMKRYDWLGRYKHISGIEQTLQEMSRRMPLHNTLYKAPEVFKENYTALEKSFFMYFPQLIAASRHKLDTFASHG